MKRKGNKIVFDSIKQKHKFRDSITNDAGYKEIIEYLGTLIAAQKQKRMQAWAALCNAVQLDQTKEHIRYDWAADEFEIAPLADAEEEA